MIKIISKMILRKFASVNMYYVNLSYIGSYWLLVFLTMLLMNSIMFNLNPYNIIGYGMMICVYIQVSCSLFYLAAIINKALGDKNVNFKSLHDM